MAEIHPTAIVDPDASLGDTTFVGPYCTVGPGVRLGEGTRLISHVVVQGNTRVGSGCTLHPFACVGGQTQDLKFKGGNPGVEIGDDNTLREYVTVNATTASPANNLRTPPDRRLRGRALGLFADLADLSRGPGVGCGGGCVERDRRLSRW